MYKFLHYLKYIGLYFLILIIITILISLINLTNINTNLITKIGIIISALSFFIVSAKASNEFSEKGYLLGLKLGLLLIITLVIINLIIFQSSFKIDRLIYYVILLASSILGGSIGKNIKIKKLITKK